MKTYISSKNSTSLFIDFVNYLKRNQLDEFTRENIIGARREGLTVLEFMPSRNEEELHETYKERLLYFLEAAAEGNAIRASIEGVEKWRELLVRQEMLDKINYDDILLSYTIRKQAMFNFILLFTTDPQEIIAIVSEIELVHHEIQKHVLGSYLFMHQERWENLNGELSEYQEVLKIANAGLEKSQADLQVANEELNATNEELTAANEELSTANEELRVSNEEQINYIVQIEEVQSKLKKSRDYYLTLLHDFPAMIWRSNTAAKCDYFNHQFTNFTGWKITEYPREEWVQLVHSDEKEKVKEIFYSAFREQQPFKAECMLRSSGGHYRCFIVYGKPIFGLDGVFSGYLGVCFDITQKKKITKELETAIEKLKESNDELELAKALLKQTNHDLEDRVYSRTLELQKANEQIALLLDSEREAHKEAEIQRKRLHSLFMHAPASLAILRGDDFVFELANPLFMDTIRRTDSLIGKPLSEVFDSLGEETANLVKEVYYSGQSFVGTEYPIEADWIAGQPTYTKYFNLILNPIIEADGKATGVIVFGYDVTELVCSRKKLEESARQITDINQELTEKNEELTRINNDLDNFIYTASHDLKAPVTNLEGLFTLLREHLPAQLGENEEKILSMVGLSITRLSKTILDLTEITKIQKGFEDVPEKVNFKEVLNEVKEDLSTLIDEAKARIVEDFQVQHVIFSKINIRSILYNLISNAIKYRSLDRAPLVHIKTYTEGNYAVLEVKDNGMGIDESHQPKLFTMFKRFHTHVEGTGIGLYAIKRIVENNKGKILFKSKKGAGSVFCVYFRNAGRRAGSSNI